MGRRREESGEMERRGREERRVGREEKKKSLRTGPEEASRKY